MMVVQFMAQGFRAYGSRFQDFRVAGGLGVLGLRDQG